MFTDSIPGKSIVCKSPKWFQKICVGFAGGYNFYLISHPEVKPKLITRAEPWMCLMNDIPAAGGSNVDEMILLPCILKKASKFTSYAPMERIRYFREPAGSNGWAIAPSRTKSKMRCF